MVVDLLESVEATRAPDDLLLISRASVWSVRQLGELVDTRAEALAEAGVAKGVVYAFTAETDPEGLATLLACWRLGATAAPLNPRLTEPERSSASEVLEGAEGSAQVILWTSGTSGQARGVCLSHNNLLASCGAVAERLQLGPSDCWLATLSMAHVGGLVLIVRALLTGATVVADGAVAAAEQSAWLDGAMARTGLTRQVTHLSLVPTQLLRLLDLRGGKPPPAAFRCALIGGATTPPDLVIRAIEDGWPLAITYGMTEMASQVATAPPDLVRTKPGCAGPPLRDVEVRILSAGEILVRGPTRALGYHGREAGAIADEQGWHHTGDFGRLDADGDLWVTGRRAERIVSGGVTIDALEVEQVIRAHPDVAEVCVVGLEDSEWGQVVAALVVGAAGGVDPQQVDVELRDRLGSAKRPKVWRLVSHLPLNANGKVDRDAVREVLGRG